MPVTLQDGTVIPDLLVEDYIALAEEAWQYRHEAAAKTVADAGLKPEDRLRALDQLDQMRGTRGPVVMWALTFKGAKRIVEVAGKKAGLTAETYAKIGPEKLIEVALEVVGVKARDGATEAESDPKKAPAT